jgi:hypothetical protein
MSYSFNNPCWFCSKKDTCTDAQKVREGIDKMYSADNQGHKGSGEILMMCTNVERQNAQN